MSRDRGSPCAPEDDPWAVADVEWNGMMDARRHGKTGTFNDHLTRLIAVRGEWVIERVRLQGVNSGDCQIVAWRVWLRVSNGAASDKHPDLTIQTKLKFWIRKCVLTYFKELSERPPPCGLTDAELRELTDCRVPTNRSVAEIDPRDPVGECQGMLLPYTPEERIIIVRKADEYTYAEIAALLGRPKSGVGRVKSIWERLQRDMKRRFPDAVHEVGGTDDTDGETPSEDSEESDPEHRDDS